MELLLQNAGLSARRVLRDGREWLVAPIAMVNPGVLAGSQGPLLYEAGDLAATAPAWNGIPITLRHPYDPTTGQPSSAGEDGVLDRQGIGQLENARFDGRKLRADGWFDVARTQAADPRVYSSLLRGEPIEQSTGLFTDNEPAPLNSVHTASGRAYTHVARNHRPDHLAVLPDQRGACSISDGCGVLVNARSEPRAENAAHPKLENAMTPDQSFQRWYTQNANPEGHNQYTKAGAVGASAAAVAAGNHAWRTTTQIGVADQFGQKVHGPGTDASRTGKNAKHFADTGDHAEAGRLHRAAEVRYNATAAFHRKRGEAEAGKAHVAAARAHRLAAEAHEGMAGTGKVTNAVDDAFQRWYTANCGGPGGKPGPCPVGSPDHSLGAAAAKTVGGTHLGTTEVGPGAFRHEIRHPNASQAAQKLAKTLGLGKDAVLKGGNVASVEDDASLRPGAPKGTKSHSYRIHNAAANQPRHLDSGQYLHTGGKPGVRQVQTAAERGATHTTGHEQEPDNDEDDAMTTENVWSDAARAKAAQALAVKRKGQTEGRYAGGFAAKAGDSAEDQHTRAMHASQLAQHLPSAESHAHANAAHNDAAALYGREGNKVREADAVASARYHLRKAKKLGLTPGTAIDNTELLANAENPLDVLVNAAASYNQAWPQARCDDAPLQDFAGPGRSFPVQSQADVDAAAVLVGNAADPDAVRAGIAAITGRKGLRLPEAWVTNADEEDEEATDNTEHEGQIVTTATTTSTTTDNFNPCHDGMGLFCHTGSHQAAEASRKASHSNSKSDHASAATAHKAAAASFKADGEDHLAALHSAAAKFHTKASKSATHNTDSEEPMTRDQALAVLAVNCACGEDRAALNTLSDATLATLAKNAKAEGSNADATGSGTTQVGGEQHADPDGDDDFLARIRRPRAVGNQQLSMNEWLELMPSEAREQHQQGQLALNQQRQELVLRLITNVTDPQRRQVVANGLLKLPLTELRERLELLPPVPAQNRFTATREPQPQWLGAAAPFDVTAVATQNADTDDVLPRPTLNYAELENVSPGLLAHLKQRV